MLSWFWKDAVSLYSHAIQGGSQVTATHAMADSNYRSRHLLPFEVDEIQQIPRVIIPAWIFPKKMLVRDPALTLLSNVRYPNASNADAALLEP
jgi:hypothetical protein